MEAKARPDLNNRPSLFWMSALQFSPLWPFLSALLPLHSMTMKTQKGWQETEFGYQLFNPEPAWQTNSLHILAFVIVNEPVNFNRIEKLNRRWWKGNQPPCECRWIPDTFPQDSDRGLDGIYMHAHTTLDVLSKEIGFQYDKSQFCDQRDTTYNQFTIANWALLVSNEAASPCPYSKESELVHLKGNTHLSLGQFLAQRVPHKEHLDVFSSHEKLHSFWDGPTQEHSCAGSVLSDEELKFKFTNPRPENTALRRTSSWVANRAGSRRALTSSSQR